MELEIITGTVDRVTFHNSENGYSVLKIRPEDEQYAQSRYGTFTAVGNLSEALDVGDSARFEGYWDEHPKFGAQFKIMGYKRMELEAMPSRPQVQPGLFEKPATPKQGEESLRGAIVHITYYNEDNGWGVIKIDPGKSKTVPPEAFNYDGSVTVVGVMPEVVEGESAEFTGRWVNNEQYGKQFKAATTIPIAPKSEQGIIRYIADTVFGIGPVTAQRIYDHFGDDTMELLDSNPERIREVGLKKSLEESFIEAWSGNRTLRQIMIHLQSYGITSRLAKRIFDNYGPQTLAILQADPYQLADDLHGIGFKKADTIARGMGIPQDAPSRLRAGLVYTLSRMALEGHTYMPRLELMEAARELLGVQEYEIDLDQQIREQLLAGLLKADVLGPEEDPSGGIYLPIYYHSESGAADRLALLANTPSKISYRAKSLEWDTYLEELAKKNDVSLTEQQQSAVRGVLSNKISVLTGGPGTGKTTTLRMVINALDEEKFTYELASPTGRAAKRLSEATGRPASTIHRLLGWNPQQGGFEHDDDEPLSADVIVIDESSMLDLILFYSLLKALRPSAHLLLVGDVDQLPSVGAGNVLNDVINSGIAHVTRLTQIFRQEDDSHIVTNAHRINQGTMPITDNDSRDFFFFNMTEPEEAAQTIVDLMDGRLARKLSDLDPDFELNPMEDVQVIAPMYRGPIGVNALNQALQERLNREGGFAEKRLGGKVFRVKDRVMQTKNNYEKEVFNGDVGTIYGIDDNDSRISVVFDGQPVEYEFSEAEEQLIHAYCISTHRSQGSEYPVVVMPVMTQHYMMLQRNLLYTAITRAKRMVVLVGTRKAVRMAVENNKVAERYSGLAMRLQQK